MKAKEELKEYRTISESEIETRIVAAHQEIMNLRFRKASGQLTQSAQIHSLRKKIARLKTVLSEKALIREQTIPGK